jgi:Arf/Sar family protein
LPTSRKELNLLLEDKEIIGIPILVLANKIDKDPHMTETEIIKGLNLDYISDTPWVVIPVSALYGTNFEQVIDWLLKQSKKGGKKK